MRVDKLLAGLVLGLMLGSVGSIAMAQKAPGDPARMAAARELVEASGGAAQAGRGMTAMRDAMLAQMRLRNPAMAKKLDGFMQDYFSITNPKTKTFLDGIVDGLARVYAERFTVAELRQVTAFQKSDVGRKFNRLVPEIMASMAPHMLTFQKAMVKDMQAHMRARQGQPQ